MDRTRAWSGVLSSAPSDQPSVVALELGTSSTRGLGLALLAVGGLAREGIKELALTIVDSTAVECIELVVDHTSSRDMRVSVRALDERWLGPSDVRGWARAGLSSLVLVVAAVDGPTNDTRRNMLGSHAKALALTDVAGREGLEIHVETPWCGGAEADVTPLLHLVEALGATLWTVSLPVHIEGAPLSPESVERLLGKLADAAERSRVTIDTRDAPHFRRVVWERHRNRERGVWSPALNDGRGMLCIDDDGQIFPSSALRIACGSVSRDDPLEVYRFHPTFRTLRDTELFDEPCRLCGYRSLCGGSRARAHAHTGKLLAADPLCAYSGGNLKRAKFGGA